MLGAGLVVPYASAVTTDRLQAGTPAEEVVVFSAYLSGMPFLVGLLVAALAEFFRRGTRLRDDTEGLRLMPPGEEHRIEVHLDRLLAARGMTLTELAEAVGVTIVNLSVLKNGRARAIRFSTLSALCEVLGCQPGDLLSHGS